MLNAVEKTAPTTGIGMYPESEEAMARNFFPLSSEPPPPPNSSSLASARLLTMA